MKKLMLILVFVFFGITSYSQADNKQYEKFAEKYSVNSITVLDRTFNVSDTITLLSGSGINGEFISIKLFAFSIEPFPANAMGRKFIILKIYNSSDGLNTFNQIVCELTKKVHVYIDPVIGLTKKEIK